MKRLHSLPVKHIERATPKSIIVTLGIDDELKSLFQFRAGQYVTIQHECDGESLRRSYSICVPEGSENLKIGVKEVDGGAFSAFANQKLQVGDMLNVLPPSGNFTLPLDDESSHMLGVAAGSGITPVISHVETFLAKDSNSKVTLIYGNKTPASIMFRERIEDLKNTFLERLTVVHVLSSTQQEIELFSGRITSEKLEGILKIWGAGHKIDCAFLCGPEMLVRDIKSKLEVMGVNKQKIFYELFTATKRKNQNLVKTIKPTVNKTTATVILDGVAHKVSMNSNQSLLDAARQSNLDAPYSCLGGICSSCRCKIVEGSGEMEVNHSLEDYEVQAGFALSCQLRPTSEKITITYDEIH